ncbi:MAG: serine hydrolase [Pseudomonadota bacterium]
MKLAQRIEGALKAAVPGGFGGAAYALVQDGQVIVSGAYGDTKLTPDTPFRICSLTKQMTALMVLIAEEDGLLSLSDPILKHCRWAKICGETVTLEHALTNQSGIKDYWCLAMAMGAEPESDFARMHADQLLAAPLDLDFEPGTRFAYSNTNFALLGQVLEAVYGEAFPDIMTEKLFIPLGMASSFVPPSTSETLPGGLIGYEEDGSAAITNLHWEGDAGVVSTAHDMSRWQLALLNPDHAYATHFARMTGPGHYSDGTRAPYRFGIRRRVRGGQLELAHFGGLRGWRSASIVQPATGTGLVLLYNHMEDPAVAADSILDLAINAPAQAPSTPIADDRVNTMVFDPQMGLAATYEQAGSATVLHCASQSWCFDDGQLVSATNDGGSLAEQGEQISVALPRDNITMQFEVLEPSEAQVTGTFRCEAIESNIIIDKQLWFVGPLGKSQPYALQWLRADLAIIPCARALDYDPPGMFTLVFDAAGLALGCWSFQNLRFEKIAA